jgi:hypothetical protein
VKPVQPFRLAGPGHGYAKMRPPGREPRRSEASSFGSRERVTGCRRWTSTPVAGVGPVFCPLSSVVCARIQGATALGLLEPGARLGLGVGELDEKGIW